MIEQYVRLIRGPTGRIVQLESRSYDYPYELRVAGEALSRPMRAPHHTVSALHLYAELALSATGYLYIDDAESWSARMMGTLFGHWHLMGSTARPTLVIVQRSGERLSHDLSALARGREVIALGAATRSASALPSLSG